MARIRPLCHASELGYRRSRSPELGTPVPHDAAESHRAMGGARRQVLAVAWPVWSPRSDVRRATHLRADWRRLMGRASSMRLSLGRGSLSPSFDRGAALGGIRKVRRTYLCTQATRRSSGTQAFGRASVRRTSRCEARSSSTSGMTLRCRPTACSTGAALLRYQGEVCCRILAPL